MAFSMNSGGGLGSRRRHGSASLSEINVTPFVDVVLVLLIIFMLTAHVMEFGMEVEVPKVKPVKEDVQDLPVISLTKEGASYLNDKEIKIHLIGDTIHQRYKNAKAVYLRADRLTTWDPIAQVIAALYEAKLGGNIVTQPEDMTGKNRR